MSLNLLLYSTQPRFIYDTLLRGEVFHARPRLDPDSWLNDTPGAGPDPVLDAYEWMCEQMQVRGQPRPGPDVFPVWAFYQWAGPAKTRPDLRFSSMKSWGKQGRQVLMTLEVPAERVLLSDYDAWHSVLNYWYLGNGRQTSSFSRSCKAQGCNYYRQKPLSQPQLHEELVGSWQRIFDLQKAPRMMGSKKADQVVQAVFWELAPEYVLRAVEFGAGRPKTVLPLPGQV